MTEQECLDKMIAPGTRRSRKYREGVIQIMVTRACDKSCFNCTQGSNYGGKTHVMTPENFELAVRSLGFRDGDGNRRAFEGFGDGRYFGVVGVFGGNPAMSPHFEGYCEVLKRLVPFEQRGLWCNHPRGKGRIMRETFDPSVSNVNVHLDAEAAAEFRRDWPEARIVGEFEDSRHSPVFVAMKDVLRKPCPYCCNGSVEISDETGEKCVNCEGKGTVPDDPRIWELVSDCDINQHWSALIGEFRGELRAWFCEVAGAQAMLHQDEPDYPDTGIQIPESSFWEKPWWKMGMDGFAHQVKKHCFECGVPLRGYGELSQSNDVGAVEQTSETHKHIARPKRKDRAVEIVTELTQLDTGRIKNTIKYVQNGRM